MLSLGLVSAAAMAARKPAPPPPTRRMSCELVSTGTFDPASYILTCPPHSSVRHRSQAPDCWIRHGSDGQASRCRSAASFTLKVAAFIGQLPDLLDVVAG